MVVPEYIMVQNIQCPECKKESVIKWTKRKTENRGLIQRYKCKDEMFDESWHRVRMEHASLPPANLKGSVKVMGTNIVTIVKQGKRKSRKVK